MAAAPDAPGSTPASGPAAPSRFERVMWRRKVRDSPVGRMDLVTLAVYWVCAVLWWTLDVGLYPIFWTLFAAAWSVAVHLRWRRLGFAPPCS